MIRPYVIVDYEGADDESNGQHESGRGMGALQQSSSLYTVVAGLIFVCVVPQMGFGLFDILGIILRTINGKRNQ